MPAISLVRRGLRGAAGGSHAASGGLGRASLQLCLLLFCGHSGSGADSARVFERAQYGRCCGTNLRLRNLDRVGSTTVLAVDDQPNQRIDTLARLPRLPDVYCRDSMGSFPRHREPDGLYHAPKVSRYRERTRMDVRRRRGRTHEAEEDDGELRQTRGAATAAGASTSSSRGGAHGLQWIAQQQHAKLSMAKGIDAARR